MHDNHTLRLWFLNYDIEMSIIEYPAAEDALSSENEAYLRWRTIKNQFIRNQSQLEVN